MEPKRFSGSSGGDFRDRLVAAEGEFLGGDEEAAGYGTCRGVQATMRSPQQLLSFTYTKYSFEYFINPSNETQFSFYCKIFI